MSDAQFEPNYTPTDGTALEGKVAIVTGAASGIGEAVARTFAANGARTVLIDRDQDRLKLVSDEITSHAGTPIR